MVSCSLKSWKPIVNWCNTCRGDDLICHIQPLGGDSLQEKGRTRLMTGGTPLRQSLLRFRFVLCALLLFGMAVIYSPAAFGQGGTGAINGTITDTSGAVIPKARVTLTNTANGAERSSLSNETGTYVFPGVIPGTYTLACSAEGFMSSKIEALKIEVNQTVTQDFSLSVGATKQEVTVQASAVHVESSTAELGTAIATREVNDLPLNGRNFLQLLSLTPGVSPISTAQNASGGGAWGGNTIGTFSFPSVNGQCNRCNFFLLDGFNNDQAFMGMVGNTPIIDGMQEFKVQSHNDSSAYGGALGGLVNVATKVGTNEYHGDVWEFLRNNALDANNFFSNAAGNPTVPYKQNQFGGVIGGPIIPGHFRKGAPKSWFFAAYEGYRSVRANSQLINVPTQQELGGDLSALTNTQIYNPWSTRPDPAKSGSYLRDPFMCDGGGNPLPVSTGLAGYPAGSQIQAAGTPCNKIPSSLINTSLVNYIKADLPPPTVNLPGGNVFDLTPNRIRQDTASLRLDHQFSENTSAWLRYTGFTQPDKFAVGWPGTTQALFDHGYQGAVSVSHTFGGGSKVLTGGFSRNSVQTNYVSRLGVPSNLWQTVGFSPAYAAIFHTSGQLNPNVNYSGFNNRPGGHIQNTHMSNIYEGKVDFTWVRGRHTMQMGADIQTNNAESPIEYIDEGFGPAQTSNLESPGGTGAGLASLLLGVIDNADYRNVHETEHGGWVDGWYFQDSWKATQKLTVNIGMRYDLTLWPIYGSLADKNQYVGDMDLDKGQYIVARVPQACDAANGIGAPCIPGGTLPDHVIPTPFSNHAIYHNTYDNLGPRLGLAYQLRPNTIIRSAFGKFFDNWGATTQLAQNYEATWPDIGQLIENNRNYPTAANPLPTVNWADPFNAGGAAVALPGPTPFNQVQWFIDPRVQNAYSLQWNLGIQQALGSSTVLEADYVGQHSSRLNEGGNRNVAVTPGPGDPGAAVDPRRPIPYITPTFYDKSIGKASYNAFQFKLRRNTSKGLSYIVSYTWSKVINLGCDGFFGAEGCFVQQVYNLKSDRSVAGFDIPHLFSANATYDLPFGPGRQFSSDSKALNAIIGHWSLNGILTLRSGEPFSVGASGDIANIGGNSERANIVGSPYPANRTIAQYINTSAFQVPAQYTFGNSGRNAYRLGSFSNIDMSLMREFPIPLGEATRLQFRAEAFNAINHPVQGGCLDTTVQDTNFGIANCTRNTEREVQFALKLFF